MYLQLLSGIDDVRTNEIEGRVLKGNDTPLPNRSVRMTR